MQPNEALGREAHFEKVRFSRSTLTEARFHKSYCQEAQFHEAVMTSAELRGADLRGAEFQRAKLQGAHFDNAKLLGARFDQANLADTYFKDAELDDRVLRSMLNAEAETWRKVDAVQRSASRRWTRREDALQRKCWAPHRAAVVQHHPKSTWRYRCTYG